MSEEAADGQRPLPRIAVPLDIDPAALADGLPQGAITRFTGRTMGTLWTVHAVLPREVKAQDLALAVTARLDDLVAQLSHWDDASALFAFNHSAPGCTHLLPGDLAHVLRAALALARETGGAFDPAIGTLVNLWGHGPFPAPIQPPTPDAIADALASGGYTRLEELDQRPSLTQPGGLHLDLSGIGKGHAVDALAEVIESEGVAHFLVEVGGEFAGRGMRPDGDPWWVELETPVSDIAPVRLALHQIAVATSGDYVRGHHTIDPRTGQPVDHALCLSVIHESAMIADGWATALGVLPPAEAMAMAERNALAVRALWRIDGGVREWISPALAAMMA